MDVNLPVLDGITATRELTARIPQAAVVILSLHDDQGTIERALAAGAVAFVAQAADGRRSPRGDPNGRRNNERRGIGKSENKGTN